jgi:hypothetical protein
MHTRLCTRTHQLIPSPRAHDEVYTAVRLHDAADLAEAERVRGVLEQFLSLPWPEPAEVARLRVRLVLRRSGPVFRESFGTEDRTTGPSPVLRGAAGPGH